MVLNAPLSVRLSDGTTDRHVTKYASALSFTKAASGGHMSCQFHLNLPRNTFDDLGPQDKCWIYDDRTADTVFGAAYLENATPNDGPAGQAFDIKAFGGMALASDESRPLIYITQELGDFEKALDSIKAGNTESGDLADDSGDPIGYGLKVQFPTGTLAPTGSVVSAGNYSMERAGMTLGAVHSVLVGGKSDANWAQELVHTGGTIATSTLTAGPASLDLYVGGGGGSDLIPPGTDRFAFRLRRSGLSTNVADDDTWLLMSGLYVLGRRMDRYGDLLTGAAEMGAVLYVLASDVVEDLLGRVLTFCDPATATVDTTTFGIDQLAYLDGAKAETVLTGLADFEPDHWWGIGGSGDNGLHQFWFREWATEPRYVVSVEDGWQQTGSDSDLCNEVQVSWTDAAGQKQTRIVTAAELGLVGVGLPVDALGSRVKQADPITLPDGRGSEANALQIGAAVLRDKINPPLAGTVTIRRPIMDLLTGNEAMPWELEPGWPVMVQEPGHLIRCTQMTYDDPSVAATLTLGRPVLTESQRIAKLARVA